MSSIPNAAHHEAADQQLSGGISVSACKGRAEGEASSKPRTQQNMTQESRYGAVTRAGGPYMIDGLVMSPQNMQVPLGLLKVQC